MAKTEEKPKKKQHRKSKEKAKEKKISKKQKSKPQIPGNPEKHNKSGKKPKKSEKNSKKIEKKHKKPEKSEVLEPQVAHPDNSLTTQTPVATKELGFDSEYDPGYLRQLLESYSKEQLVDLICTTAQKGSRLISAVIESAERDATQRRIFVHGLGWDTTRDNLVAAFEPYGEIEDCTVIMDKATSRAKGFGFVLFKTLKGAREALKNPHKRLFNRTIMCHLASERPSGGGGKVREMAEPVKIELPQTANHGQVPGHEHHTGSVLAGQGIPFFGHPPGLNPMYGGLMGNLMLAGVPNYTGFGSGVMSQGLLVPPNHAGVVGQYGGDGARGDSERAWYLW